MTNTDGITIAAMQGILVVVLVRALIGSRRGIKLTVNRGEQSMNFLYLSYGVTTVVYSLAIDVADFALGHKATIIAIDYLMLTYLFIFNSWFRNAVVFKLLQDVGKD